MKVRVSFHSGPLHGQTAVTDKLPDYKVFFNERERLVYLYRRDERDYTYDIDKSKRASDIFDETKSFFAPRTPGETEFDPSPVNESGEPAD